jgi:hypothetical protein
MPYLNRHLNIGAGRIVWQDIVRIDVSIKKRQFHKSKNIVDSFNRAKEGNGRLHLLGLVSDLCYLCAGVSRQDNAGDLFVCLCGSLVDLMGSPLSLQSDVHLPKRKLETSQIFCDLGVLHFSNMNRARVSV